MKNPPAFTLPTKQKSAQSRVQFPIRTKLALYSFLIAAVTVLVVAFLAYYVSAQTLRTTRLDEFRALRNTVSQAIQSYFNQVRSQIAGEAETETVRQAVTDFTAARANLLQDLQANGFTPDESFYDLIATKNTDTFNSDIGKSLADVDQNIPDSSIVLPNTNEGKILQYVYISTNPSPLGHKNEKNTTRDILGNSALPEAFRNAFAKTAYAKAMDRYQPFFNSLAVRYNVSDLELIDNDANVVYTYAKRFDFGVNLQRDYWKRHSELGRIFLGTWCTPLSKTGSLSSDQVVNSDYTRYLPALDNPMMLLGCGIPSAPDEVTGVIHLAGVLIHELPSDSLDKIVSFNQQEEKAGLGTTGEAYLVGYDHLARTESRFPGDLKVGDQTLPLIDLTGHQNGVTSVLKLALNSDIDKKLFDPEDPTNQTEGVYTDYRGHSALGLCSPLPLPGVNWGLVTKIDATEAFASATQLGIVIAGIGLLVLLGVVIVSFITANIFSRPIVAFAEVADAIAAGSTDRRAEIKSRDEIGFLASRFNSMVDQIVATNQQLAIRNDQTAKIMSTVREGLLLVDTQGKILPEHSNASRAIFQAEDLSGLNLLNLIEKIVPAKVYQDCKSYVEVLLDPWVEEDFVIDINPLAQLKVSLPTERGDFETKFLEFRFKRVYGEENKIIYLLVTVADATERVSLSEKLEAAKENTRSQLSLLLGLTHIERPRLNQFFEETDREIRKINALLKVSTSSNVDMIAKSVDYVDLTNTVFRDIHTIKGHARLLSLEFFELGATKLEEKVAELREEAKLGTLQGQDFIPLVVGLQEFFHELTELRRLFSRLSGDLEKGVPNPSTPTPSAPVRKHSLETNAGAESTDSNRLVNELTAMVQKLSQENNKQIQVNSFNFDLEMVPERYRTGLSGMLIHLVTNSAIHGIEGQLERRSSGKPSTGTIKLTTYLGQDERVWVTVQDDGRGYDVEAIRKKAMQLYGVPEEYFATWTQEQITHMVFYDGLSTAESLTRAAGRGVGLSAVAAKASEFGGSVHVQSVFKKGSTFYLSMATTPLDFEHYPALKRLKETRSKVKFSAGFLTLMATKTLLIVDDSQMMLQAIQMAIPPNVFSTILEARNGVDAVRIYKEARPDFVTMDITMPQLDGLDCIKQIREFDPRARILIISALADVSKSIEAVKRGAKGFLLKPINTDKLQQAITRMVSKNE